MAVYVEQEPRTVTGAEPEFELDEQGFTRPQVRVAQSNQGSSGTLTYIVAALVLIVVGYLLFRNDWNAPPTFPTITQTLPSPDVMAPLTPTPAAPPVSQTTPPAAAPVTP